MELIDDEGRLFGLVNVIDALALLVVAAAVLGGVALLTDEPAPTETAEVTIRATVPPWEAAAVEPGPIAGTGPVANITGVERVATFDVGFNASVPNRPEKYVRLRISATVETDAGQSWRVGERVAVDLGDVRIDGVVVELGGSE